VLYSRLDTPLIPLANTGYRLGDSFLLWEGKTIAPGKVTRAEYALDFDFEQTTHRLQRRVRVDCGEKR
jgi:hypothetical protein